MYNPIHERERLLALSVLFRALRDAAGVFEGGLRPAYRRRAQAEAAAFLFGPAAALPFHRVNPAGAGRGSALPAVRVPPPPLQPDPDLVFWCDLVGIPPCRLRTGFARLLAVAEASGDKAAFLEAIDPGADQRRRW